MIENQKMPFGLGKTHEATKEKPEMKIQTRYMGGHKMYPKSTDTKVLLFHDRMEVEKPSLKVPYEWITNIENADESKITAMRIVLTGVIALFWKKKRTYTVIQYKDAIGEQQSLIFDFENDINKIQPIIYQKMLDARSNASAQSQ